MPDVNSALAEMRADPESFLRHYLVTIATGVPGGGIVLEQQATFRTVAGSQTFNGFRTGISRITGQMTGRSQLQIMKTPEGTIAGANEAVFQAWYIPMTDAGGGGGLSHHVLLSGTEGPDIAFTSQVSGCTVGIGSARVDGSRLVSHIRPPSGQPNDQTYADMRKAASLGSMATIFDRPSRPGARSYGNPNNRATIIGVRTAGQWRFYAQIYNLATRDLFKVERL